MNNTDRIEELKEKDILNEVGKPLTDYIEGFNDGKRVIREECQKEFQEKIEKFTKTFDKNDKDTIWSSAVVYFEFKQIFGEQQ